MLINAFPSGAKEGYDHHIEITTSQTWTVPDGVTEIAVRLFGGGGQGGRSHTYALSQLGAGGGGGGHMAYKVLTVTPGTKYAITIGAGGYVDDYTQIGASGGTTSFGDLLFALGGQGGEGREEDKEYVVGRGIGGSGGTGGGGGIYNRTLPTATSTFGTEEYGRGGDASYGGAGGSILTVKSNGGLYGGRGGNYFSADNGVESLVAKTIIDSYISSWSGGVAAYGGGGGYKANGGAGQIYYDRGSGNRDDPTYIIGCGGGGGYKGGDGGNGSNDYGSWFGGGGGGYGTQKIAGDGLAKGGLGYGAGGGGSDFSSSRPNAGAPGICIIEY